MSMNSLDKWSFSELELFKRSAAQIHILNGELEKIYPITKLKDSRPTKFLLENATDHFLELIQRYLNIKFKMVNSDGSHLAADAKTSLVNYAIAFLFQ